tara:strand:+ start:2151 stop:2474 length:324 start_codon:yes stop_codon:yes gene_type:complete
MQTIKIGRTTYKLNDARDIYAQHAKCTGKHRIVKSKGAEKRRYPAFYDGMSTREYVGLYFELNTYISGRRAPYGMPYGPDVDVEALFEPLNIASATVYTGKDTHELC